MTSTFPQNSEVVTTVSPKLRLTTEKLIDRDKWIPSAEKCEKCGYLDTEYRIQTHNGMMLRRCKTCFNEMRLALTKVEFVKEE